ncbi:ShlB/FhaC/HecB family hemolysin secretion/activation protein [Marinomonas epiphytica]
MSEISYSAEEETIRNQADWRLRNKEAEETLNRSLEEARPPIQLPQPPVTPQIVEDEEVCFVVDHIEVNGLLSDWALAQGEQYLGQCIGVQTLKAYVRLINQKLLADGYVTSRAVLPEQNIASRTVMIKVEEGFVERIVFPREYRFSWKNALPVKEGKVLSLRDMEQAVEQLSRLHSQDVKFSIKPGNYPNSSILIAEVKQSKSWLISTSIDDSGSEATGKYPLTVNAVVDNFVGAQDVLATSFSRSRGGAVGESNSRYFSWSMPFGYWLLGLSYSHSDYLQVTQGSVRDFELSGNSQNSKLSLDYVALRNNKAKLTLNSELKTRTRRSYVEDAEINAQRRNLTELDLGLNYRHFLGRSIFDFSFDIHQGIDNWLGADKRSLDAAENVAQPDYRFYSMSLSLNHPFTFFEQQMNYTGRLFAQYSDTAIYSLDWFSNGGRYTVRGFNSDESLSAEHGWRLKNDVGLPIPINSASFFPYLGLDIGQVSGDGAENETSRTMMGVTVGVKGDISNMNFDIAVSEPFIEYGPYAKKNDF